MIKLEILGHVEQSYFQNTLNVHHIHEFFLLKI